MSSEKSKKFAFPSLSSSHLVSEEDHFRPLSSPQEDSQEDQQLLSSYRNIMQRSQRWQYQKLHVVVLYLVILALLIFEVFALAGNRTGECENPALNLWCEDAPE
jgi:hypothetical protein